MASYYGGATLSPEATAQVLYQAGVRGEDLVQLVAIAKRESGYNTGAHRTDSARSKLSGDRGLLQINYRWDQELQAAGIIQTKADLFDPLTNARAAVYVLNKQGLGAWKAGNGGTPGVEAARAAVTRATQSGAVGSDWSSGSSGASGSTASGGGTAKATSIPSDATIVRTRGSLYAVFDTGFGQSIFFTIGDPSAASGRAVQDLTDAQWQAKYPNGYVNGGDASELTNVTTAYSTFNSFWESITTQVIGTNNPAANDPGVRKVLLDFAARPDMSEAELQNKLKGTSYWQSKTEGELQWNSLSSAEQAARRQDTASRMAQTWFQLVGEDVPPSYWRLQNNLEDVASGKMGFSQWTETVVKPRALIQTESPWARQVRTEVESQRQRPIDIENTTNRVRETVNRWGLKWSEGELLKWGKGIVEKTQSDDDLMEVVKNLAQVLYPWKDREMETMTAASPWLETYKRVMEEEGSLFTTDVQKALTAGQPVWDFEQGLKKSSKWLNTRNAREELFSVAAEVGSRMGYN